MKTECYISVDIESSGPVVGLHSMLSIGACVVGDEANSFYAELKPISRAFDPEALKVSNLDLSELARNGEDSKAAMERFNDWVIESSSSSKPVFVGFNACYDWQFVNWYFLTYLGSNPFGFGGVDIKAYFMGKAGVGWLNSTSSQLPPRFQPDSPLTHNALDDAKSQASIFRKLIGNKSI
jgi:hypothetical protein